MGFGATRLDQRAAAMLGSTDTAVTCFENCRSVSNGGVLFALAPLLANGLLKDIDEYFSFPPRNFYRLDQIMLVLSFSILLRVMNLDQLQYRPAGEWGKLLGLDRIPEKKTMRRKVEILSRDVEQLQRWNSSLINNWLGEATEATGLLYIDGHVRVYHGGEKLPRRYVARQRLCLRGMTDYWCHDGDGLPLLVVTTPLTDGLLAVIRDEIVPKLLTDIPDQPTEQELAENPLLARFCIIFDREGYSPKFFKDMWQTHRIACMTYHKHPKDKWSPNEFKEVTSTDKFGNQSTILVAERGSLIGSGKNKVWVRELRRSTEGDRQVSLISTFFTASQAECCQFLSNRWTQENFFKYARIEFGIDSLGSYELEDIPPDKLLTNPQYRTLSNKIRGLNSKLSRRILKREKIQLDETLDPIKTERSLRDINILTEEIQEFSETIEQHKSDRSSIPKKLPFKDLPQAEKFRMFSKSRHQFTNIIRMIAYRAETSLYNTLREAGFGPQSRSFIRDIFQTDADLEVDADNNKLTVRLHHQANAHLASASRILAQELNESQIEYPGTDMRVHYEILAC